MAQQLPVTPAGHDFGNGSAKCSQCGMPAREYAIGLQQCPGPGMVAPIPVEHVDFEPRPTQEMADAVVRPVIDKMIAKGTLPDVPYTVEPRAGTPEDHYLIHHNVPPLPLNTPAVRGFEVNTQSVVDAIDALHAKPGDHTVTTFCCNRCLASFEQAPVEGKAYQCHECRHRFVLRMSTEGLRYEGQTPPHLEIIDEPMPGRTPHDAVDSAIAAEMALSPPGPTRFVDQAMSRLPDGTVQPHGHRQRCRIWTNVCQDCKRVDPETIDDWLVPLTYHVHPCGCVVNICEILEDEDHAERRSSSLVLFGGEWGSQWVKWPTVEMAVLTHHYPMRDQDALDRPLAPNPPAPFAGLPDIPQPGDPYPGEPPAFMVIDDPLWDAEAGEYREPTNLPDAYAGMDDEYPWPAVAPYPMRRRPLPPPEPVNPRWAGWLVYQAACAVWWLRVKLFEWRVRHGR